MENNIGEIITNSLDSIRQLAGVNTIVGDPINTPGGTVIIPISKVSLGFASGGVDFDPKEKKEDAKTTVKEESVKINSSNGKNGCKNKNFGGGGGTGITIAPIGFLVVKADGEVDLLNITVPQNNNIVDSITDLIERSPDIITRLKGVFSSKKNEEEEDILGDDAKSKSSDKSSKDESAE